jgi:hypothetical protein
MNQLSLTVDLEDYTAGLTGRFKANGFKGFGEGWFNTSDIVEFCNTFEALTNSLEGETELIAGESKSDGSEYLELFGLRCYVLSKTGIIGVHTTLAETPYTDCRPQEISTVTGEIKIDVQSSFDFIKSLRSLCLNEVSEVTLIGRE